MMTYDFGGKTYEIWKHIYKSEAELFTYKVPQDILAKFGIKPWMHTKDIVGSGSLSKLLKRIKYWNKPYKKRYTRIGIFNHIRKNIQGLSVEAPKKHDTEIEFAYKEIKEALRSTIKFKKKFKRVITAVMEQRPHMKLIGIREELKYDNEKSILQVNVSSVGRVEIRYSLKALRGYNPVKKIETLDELLEVGIMHCNALIKDYLDELELCNKRLDSEEAEEILSGDIPEGFREIPLKDIDGVFVKDGNQLIVTGVPKGDHACDEMGCGSFSHVILRKTISN